MASDYFLLFKTAPAEFQAWSVLDTAARSSTVPIVELTRGRKRPKAVSSTGDPASSPEMYGFARILEQVGGAFSACDRVILDLTREPLLSCYEIEQLSLSAGGYENWRRFLLGERTRFQNLIPTLIVNPADGETEDDYVRNLREQFRDLASNFSGVAYRVSLLLDPDFFYDIQILSDLIGELLDSGKQFFVALDHEFIRPGMGILHALTSSEVIKRLRDDIPRATFVTLATSFPKTIGEIGDPDHDSFPNEEVFLFEEVERLVGPDVDLRYGDYGSVNPTRNDQSGGSGGWRPRIDFPTSKNRTYYYREKRERDTKTKVWKYSYDYHYTSVAKDVVADDAFERVPGSWGVAEILKASEGRPGGRVPRFWISVRMEIHIRQQLRRLGLA